MSLYEFYQGIGARHAASNTERYCQAAFTHLHEVRPDLAEQVRGTDKDPFYITTSHPNWARFVAFIDENWHLPIANEDDPGDPHSAS